MNVSRIAVIVLALVTAYATAQAPDLENMDIVLRSVPNGPVAKVFGQNIPAAKFVSFYKFELAQLLAANPNESLRPEDRVELARWCLRELVEEELLWHEAEKRSIKVGNAEAEKAWADRLDAMRENLELEGADASEKAILARLRYASRKDAMADVKRALRIRRTRDAIVEEIGVTIDEERVRKVYENAGGTIGGPALIHLRHIFIRAEIGEGEFAKRQRDDARRRAEATLARIDAGQSFESVVRAVSEAPDKADGGELGPAPPEKLPAYLVGPAMALEPDEVSDVIETDEGFHIVQLISRKSAEDPGLDAVAPVIRRRLLAREGEVAVRRYFSDQLGNSDDIQVFLQLERSLSLYQEYSE